MKNFTYVLSKRTSLLALSLILTCGVFLGLHAAPTPAPAPTLVNYQVKGDGTQAFVKWVYNDVVTGSNQFIVEQQIGSGAFAPIACDSALTSINPGAEVCCRWL